MNKHWHADSENLIEPGGHIQRQVHEAVGPAVGVNIAAEAFASVGFVELLAIIEGHPVVHPSFISEPVSIVAL